MLNICINKDINKFHPYLKYDLMSEFSDSEIPLNFFQL